MGQNFRTRYIFHWTIERPKCHDNRHDRHNKEPHQEEQVDTVHLSKVVIRAHAEVDAPSTVVRRYHVFSKPQPTEDTHRAVAALLKDIPPSQVERRVVHVEAPRNIDFIVVGRVEDKVVQVGIIHNDVGLVERGPGQAQYRVL